MRAWTYDRYGGSEVLALTDVPQPVPGSHEVLIRVEAAALNAADRYMMQGRPLVIRATTGFGARPRRVRIIGSDVAGTVTAVGGEVGGLTVGDRVHAEVDEGGAAEFVAVPRSAVAAVPQGLSMPQAAAVGMAAITALKAVQAGGRIEDGTRVLVNGASGGVGSFAVQLALAAGAEVTAVTSSRNMELVLGLGAQRVIAYDRQDFVTATRGMDVLLDTVGNRSLRELRRVVHRRGRVILIGGGGGRVLGPAGMVVAALAMNPFVAQRLVPVTDSRPSGDDLRTVDALIEQGRVHPLIDRVVPFAEVPAAVALLETRRARGKIVIDLSA